ncbi:hypothetical protein HanIR_Chr01g0006431 [Helianthus annuus]|nr:hypothetical protein HanIR_Chr01g0006431 [Helianthus annuus]
MPVHQIQVLLMLLGYALFQLWGIICLNFGTIFFRFLCLIKDNYMFS